MHLHKRVEYISFIISELSTLSTSVSTNHTSVYVVSIETEVFCCGIFLSVRSVVQISIPMIIPAVKVITARPFRVSLRLLFAIFYGSFLLYIFLYYYGKSHYFIIS